LAPFRGAEDEDNRRVAAPFFALLVAGATWLVVAKAPRLAPWFLGLGALLFGFFWLLGQLRIPWPDLGMPTVLLVNPYLLATLSFTLLLAGAIGTIVRVVRRARSSN